MSARPALPLDQQTFCVLRGQPEAQAIVEVTGEITAQEQLHRGVDVLRDRLRGDPLDLLDGVPSEDSARPATKGAVPGVPRGKDYVVPLALVVLHDVRESQVDLEYVGVEEMLWRLHDGDPRIGEEEADCA